VAWIGFAPAWVAPKTVAAAVQGQAIEIGIAQSDTVVLKKIGPMSANGRPNSTLLPVNTSQMGGPGWASAAQVFERRQANLDQQLLESRDGLQIVEGGIGRYVDHFFGVPVIAGLQVFERFLSVPQT
jgi:hypothetical protein